MNLQNQSMDFATFFSTVDSDMFPVENSSGDPRAEKVHKCPYCNHTSNRRYNLSKHILTHTGERPFACPFCPFRSIWKRALQIHIYTRHSENNGNYDLM